MREIELESEDLQAALKELRLPVVDNQDKLIGIISRADIVRAVRKQ